MSCIDDEWTSFLTQGAIILSNEKNSAKNNVTHSYQQNMDSTMTSYTAIVDTKDSSNIVLKPLSEMVASSTIAKNSSKELKPSKQSINISSFKTNKQQIAYSQYSQIVFVHMFHAINNEFHGQQEQEQFIGNYYKTGLDNFLSALKLGS